MDARGIELSQRGVNDCVAKGLSVIQGDADTDLADYPDNAFDYVILSQTLQATRQPRTVLEHMLRIGRHAIVSFPNFGHWRIRLQVAFGGRMPMTPQPFVLLVRHAEHPFLHDPGFCRARAGDRCEDRARRGARSFRRAVGLRRALDLELLRRTRRVPPDTQAIARRRSEGFVEAGVSGPRQATRQQADLSLARSRAEHPGAGPCRQRAPADGGHRRRRCGHHGGRRAELLAATRCGAAGSPGGGGPGRPLGVAHSRVRRSLINLTVAPAQPRRLAGPSSQASYHKIRRAERCECHKQSVRRDKIPSARELRPICRKPTQIAPVSSM